MSKHLIFGGAGFLGGNLARKLVSLGMKPKIFTRPTSSLNYIIDILDKVEIIYGDWTDFDSIEKSVKDVDIVYHLITTTFPSSTLDSCVFDIQSNLIPTVKLVEACLQNQVSQLIYASSGGTVYGEPQFLPITEEHPLNPRSIYGQSKLMIEQLLNFYARSTPLSIKVLRISNPFGPGQKILGIQGLVAVAMGCALYDREIKILGEGNAVRDYIFIDDVINALIASVQYPENITVNIASAEGKSIKDIIQGIEQVTGKVLKKSYLPERPGDVKINVLSNQLAKNLLKWSPESDFYESLDLTWKALSKQ